MYEQSLIKQAMETKAEAYAPYSNFRVGAALLTKSGKVYTGVNIENVSFGAACCAERTAVFKAVSEGEKEFESIAIASDQEGYIYPCGICRQVLAEFCNEDFVLLCSDAGGRYKKHTLKELLPEAFNMIRNRNTG